MEISIKGDPGTGNVFIEIHIQHVENLILVAPTVSASDEDSDLSPDVVPRPDRCADQ